MEYMISVDLETMSISRGATDCQSTLHEAHDRHYDLTVHVLGCGCRREGGAHCPPTRYRDDNGSQEYTLQEVVRGSERFRLNMLTHTLGAAKCDVGANPPHRD
jgi:hypothetical protein